MYSKNVYREFVKYINLFIDSRSNRIKDVRHFVNEETGVTYSFFKKDGEGIFCFYTKKSTVNFIRNFTIFRKTTIKKDGKIEDKDRYYFNKYLETVNDIDLVAINFRNTKLVNPFRNYLPPSTISNCKNKTPFLLIDINKKKIYIHSGFVYLFNSISSHFFSLLSDALKDPEIKKIVIVGHAFGGAIAKLAFISGILAHPEKHENFFGYFYGSPKVGNLNFEVCLKQFNKFHIKFSDDYLTEMPKESIGYIEPNDSYILDRSSTDLKKQTDSYSYAKRINEKE